jgi:secreted PhoX family phosphatase
MSHPDHSLPVENTSNNEHFQDVLARGLANPSRRAILRGGVGLSAATMLPVMSACGSTDATQMKTLAEPIAAAQIKFNAVAKSIADSVVLPAGYTAKVLHATGDPIDRKSVV